MRRFTCITCLACICLLSVALLGAQEAKPKGTWDEVGVSNASDNGDISDKVDVNVKVAQTNTGKGVVWGKANKQPQQQTAEPPKKIAAPAVPEKPATERQPVNNADVGVSDKVYLLQSERKVGSTDLVETLLEVTGDMKQITAEMKTVTEKMEVVAGFRYEERITKYSTSEELASLREYDLAKAKMKFGTEQKTPELDESLRTINASLDGDKVSLFSPNGPLRGEQLLLVEDLPGNTLTLDRLLPDKEVKIGDAWKIKGSVLRSFLSVDAVTEGTVDAVLTAVAENMAMVEIVGDIKGIYLGAATEMSIRAKYQFDMTAKRINWLGLLIEENRSLGHVGPGLDLVARLQVKISPVEKPQKLTNDFMKEISLKPSDKLLMLKYDGGKGPWRFSHGRDWYVFQDDTQSTILRKLYRGDLVAQCNIADMGKVDVKTMTTLAKFQQELVNGLGKSFGKVVSAEELDNKFGYKEFNVIIDGTVDDLDLRWIYSLLTDKDGQQSVIVFVVEAQMLDTFADSDRVLINTYRMGKK